MGITEDQKREALELFYAGGDNRDAVIAEKIGIKTSTVSAYLREEMKIKMDRINKKRKHENV